MATFDFHPSARKAIDDRGTALLTKFQEHSIAPRPPPSFPTERPIAATFTDKDVLGDLIFGEQDIIGNLVARYAGIEGKVYGLATDAYRDLRRLVDQVAKTPWVEEAVGKEFIEDQIFLWCRANFQSSALVSLASHLLSSASDSVSRFTVWVPVAHLEVEHTFEFGPVRIAPITAEMLDEREQKFAAKQPEHGTKVKTYYDRLRREIQGRAAIVIELEAEAKHAQRRGLEVAEVVIALLRMYSPAAFVPRLVCTCAVVGSEYVPTTLVMSYGAGEAFTMARGMSKPTPHEWRISGKEWAAMRSQSLQSLPDLIYEAGLTDFQKRLRVSLLAYSKGTTLRDINDRLVYTLSALEGLLLRDGSEPIQQNLGERLAFALERDATRRQEIVQNVREIYQMRSRYIHHRASVVEEEAVEKFIASARALFDGAMANASKFKTAREFVEAIDRVKFGG